MRKQYTREASGRVGFTTLSLPLPSFFLILDGKIEHVAKWPGHVFTGNLFVEHMTSCAIFISHYCQTSKESTMI